MQSNGKEKEFKTKYGCVVESHESTRQRAESLQSKIHEDRIAGKEFTSVTHYNLVHKFITRPQAMKIPGAKAAVDKEWEKLGRRQHMKSNLRSWGKQYKQNITCKFILSFDHARVLGYPASDERQHRPEPALVQNSGRVDDDKQFLRWMYSTRWMGRKNLYIKEVLDWFPEEDAGDLRRRELNKTNKNMTALNALEGNFGKWKWEKLENRCSKQKIVMDETTRRTWWKRLW